MKKDIIIDNLNKLASNEPSKWIEKAKFRDENRKWLDKSAKIAIRILKELRNKKMSQLELAEKLMVSPQYINKIVKGGENLSLETITRIESVLGITLIAVPTFESVMDYPKSNLESLSLINRRQAKPLGSEYKKYSEYTQSQLEQEPTAA